MSSENTDISNIQGDPDNFRSQKFEAIYRRYFEKLYGYARAICGSQSMAKDVVSEFFFHLWKNKTDLSRIENLEIYLLVSIKNRAIQMLAKERKADTSDNSFDLVLETIEYINPEELLLEKELKDVLDNIINALPDQGQLIFRMAREKGLTQSEIARELGISVTTVKSQLKRSQSKLRAEILKFYMDSESDSHPDIRLIGQIILLAGTFGYEIFK